jgi:glutathione S-transferase
MKSALKIYGIARTRTVRALWMAEELRIPYDHVDIQRADGSNRAPAYLALNPNGRVPTIDDGGFVLWESLAINLYLAKKYGGALYPRAPESEALAWQWSFWVASDFDKPIVEWALHDSVLPADQRDPAKAAAARQSMEQPLQVLDGALATKRYLIDSDTFTVADLNVAATLYRALWMDLSAKPHVAEWLRRCWDRPAARRARAMRE